MRRAAQRVALALAVLGALVLAVPTTAVASAPSHQPAFGVQFHGMWASYDDADRARFLDQLAATGASWVRLDVSWAMLQPTSRDSYDMRWGVPFVDRVIDMVRARGLTPLVTLWRTPAWANGGASEVTLPHDPADFARAAAWAAARWKGKVPAWEVWNEPNDRYYMVGADPVAYTRLLKAAYPAIKAADPGATVLFGGVASNDSPWLARAYAAGAKGSFDAMATHPYMAVADLPPEVPDDGTPYHFTHLAGVHALMARHGDGHKPIWATEFGWSTHANAGGEPNWLRGVTAQQQADYAVRALRLVEQTMPYVTHLFWFTDKDRASGDVHLDSYGFFDRDLRPKPIVAAVTAHLAGRGAAAPAPAPAPPVAGSPSTAPPAGGSLWQVVDCASPVEPVLSSPTVLCGARTLTR